MTWRRDRRTLWISLVLAGLLLTACGTPAGGRGSGATATAMATPPATVIRVGTPGSSATPVLPSTPAVPGTPGTPGSPSAGGTPQVGKEALRAVLLSRIGEYQRAIEAAARDGRCDPPAQGTPSPICKDIALAAMRKNHPEFAAYILWLEREFNCGPATATPGPCTLVAILPSPEQLRDPANLDRYLDVTVK